MIGDDRFPYNMPSRDALVKLASTDLKKDFDPKFVNFDDMFFAPLPTVPGRTFIEMIDRKANAKFWFAYRRLDLGHPRALGTNTSIKITGLPTPASIATEINRSRGMTFGPDDVSFSTAVIQNRETTFIYKLKAMTGSYAYYGEADILVEVVETVPFARYLEDGDFRLLENGQVRELEH